MNSPLVTCTKISPHRYLRTAKISKITIHHVAGVADAEGIGNNFTGSRVASSNYGIGNDGSIGLYVPEDYRAVTSSSPTNDNQAITIEVSNSAAGGDWPVSDKALAALIDLCVDICRRNGIERLSYTDDATGNLTRHNMFAATACPGPYLQGKFPYIADVVNKQLSGVPDDTPPAWAAGSWQKAIAKGIIKGDGNGLYRPNDNVTRAELAVILDRLGFLE